MWFLALTHTCGDAMRCDAVWQFWSAGSCPSLWSFLSLSANFTFGIWDVEFDPWRVELMRHINDPFISFHTTDTSGASSTTSNQRVSTESVFSWRKTTIVMLSSSYTLYVSWLWTERERKIYIIQHRQNNNKRQVETLLIWTDCASCDGCYQHVEQQNLI